jgi:hypothetical protein
MSLTSVFKSPDASIATGLAEAALVIGIYSHNLPQSANVRYNPQPHDKNLEACRKAAAQESLGVLAILFLLTRDWNSFLIGGAVLTGVDMYMKHHNATVPGSGAIAGAAVAGAVQPDQDMAYTPVPEQHYTHEDMGEYVS